MQTAKNPLHPLSDRGTEMMTPFPVPIHRRLHDTNIDVMRTKEKPSFPVPGIEESCHSRSDKQKADNVNITQII